MAKTNQLKPLYAWTPKEQAFVRAYARHGNGGRAVREAGYECLNPPSAWALASELLNKPHIQDWMEKQREIAMRESDYSPERILREVALIAFANPGKMIRTEEVWTDDKPDAENAMTGPQKKEEGRPPDRVVAYLDLNDITELELRTIAEITESEFGLKVKFHSKVAALEMLGKHHRLWIDRVELGADEDLIERLRRGRDRARQAIGMTPEGDDDGPEDER